MLLFDASRGRSVVSHSSIGSRESGRLVDVRHPPTSTAFASSTSTATSTTEPGCSSGRSLGVDIVGCRSSMEWLVLCDRPDDMSLVTTNPISRVGGVVLVTAHVHGPSAEVHCIPYNAHGSIQDRSSDGSCRGCRRWMNHGWRSCRGSRGWGVVGASALLGWTA